MDKPSLVVLGNGTQGLGIIRSAGAMGYSDYSVK